MAIISGDMSDLQSKLTNAQVDVNNRLSGEALQRAEDFSRFQASLEQVQMVANGSVSEQKVCIYTYYRGTQPDHFIILPEAK